MPIQRVTDADFPPQLAAIDDPPKQLFAIGNAEILHLPQIAIVGARHATPGGLANARAFAAALSRAGFIITSGLARGVDAAAHEGALAAGGLTIAVCATGLDVVYPPAHAALAERIAASGALLSEQDIGTPPRPGLFPRRNRLIAGLALATLVVEAGLRSGSLITARLAAEQGREVFALPGSIHNPMARGCHRLIRDGAQLVEDVGQVLEALAPQVRALALAVRPSAACEAPPSPPSLRSKSYRKLLAALDYEPVTLDQIVMRCGLTTPVVSSMLVLLELEGAVAALQGGRYQRVRFDRAS